MMIEIHKPELEALIQDRMRTGAFEDIEDILRQALQSKQNRPLSPLNPMRIPLK